EFLRQLGLVPRERLERTAAIARPRPGLHDAADPLLGERIQILQAGGVAFYGQEVANPPGGVHLPHETITDLRRQTGSVLVLPIFKWTSVGNLEAVEERTVNAHVPSRQMRRVDVDPASGQT